MKKVFLLFIVMSSLFFLSCKDEITMESLMYNLGTDNIAYPSWFDSGTYQVTSDPNMVFCFFTESFKFKTQYQQMALNAKKVGLEILNDSQFSLTVRNKYFVLKFIITRNEEVSYPEIRREYYETDGSVTAEDDWGWIKKVG